MFWWCHFIYFDNTQPHAKNLEKSNEQWFLNQIDTVPMDGPQNYGVEDKGMDHWQTDHRPTDGGDHYEHHQVNQGFKIRQD